MTNSLCEISMLQHLLVVHEADTTAKWKTQVGGEFQTQQLIGKFSLDYFTLNWIAVAGLENLRYGLAANKTVEGDFV